MLPHTKEALSNMGHELKFYVPTEPTAIYIRSLITVSTFSVGTFHRDIARYALAHINNNS